MAPARLRPFEPGDEEALLPLKCASFPGLILEQERVRWRWEFEANPCPPPPFPTALVIEVASELLGSFVFLPYRVQIGSETRFGASGIDLCVHPKLRGEGWSTELTRRWLAPGFADFPFAVALNDASRHLFPKHGAKLLGGTGESIAWAYFIEAAHEPPPATATPLLHVEPVLTLDAECDALWQRVRRHHRLLLLRDAAYWNWRYRDYPFGGTTLLAARNDGDASDPSMDRSVRGLAALQLDPATRRLYLADLMHEPDDLTAQRSLVRRAVELARSSGQEVLWYSTRDPRQLPVLRDEGFVLVPGPVPTFCARVHHQPSTGPVDPTAWYTAIGDGDQLFDANTSRQSDNPIALTPPP